LINNLLAATVPIIFVGGGGAQPNLWQSILTLLPPRGPRPEQGFSGAEGHANRVYRAW